MPTLQNSGGKTSPAKIRSAGIIWVKISNASASFFKLRIPNFAKTPSQTGSAGPLFILPGYRYAVREIGNGNKTVTEQFLKFCNFLLRDKADNACICHFKILSTIQKNR